jgi:hypothetical protein
MKYENYDQFLAALNDIDLARKTILMVLNNYPKSSIGLTLDIAKDDNWFENKKKDLRLKILYDNIFKLNKNHVKKYLKQSRDAIYTKRSLIAKSN